MEYLRENVAPDSIAWFRRWFDSTYYHKLYAHRDDREAESFMNALMKQLEPTPYSSIIDVGCGSGRHCRYLASKGFSVTGIDLAFSNIKEAKKNAGNLASFFRHDMRIPFGNKNFDYVFNFFTSFGYFKNDNEHNLVIKNMCDALKPGGILVLDYLNPVYAEKNLIPAEQREIDGIVYDITRWTDQNFIYKKIAINDTRMPGFFEHTEKVAKFNLEHFEDMFLSNGLFVDHVFGDYHLGDFNRAQSPRMIIVATKAELQIERN